MSVLVESRPARSKLRLGALPLYLAFAATGVGVALPGVLLPVLLAAWHLRDEQGGRLLFMAWMGSSGGALLVRGELRRTLLGGSCAIALGAVALALCGGAGAWGWFALYGVGLGVVMTSVSLLRQQQTDGSGREMVRLNLVWAIGACVCPSLMAGTLRSGKNGPVLYGLAVFFAGLAAWCVSQSELRLRANDAAPESGSEVAQWEVLRRVPLALIVLTLLITGVEASAGGWLATYARRGGEGAAFAVAAPTCLWVGLLLSRLFWSLRRAERVPQVRVVRGSLALMMVAAAGLIWGGRGELFLAAVFCLGFGIGPVYPLLLAWALRFHRGGAIFFLAGVGSAVLPWLTGIVSTQRGSLRTGLAVPAVAVAVMLTLAVAGPLRVWSGEAAGRGPA